MHSPKIVIAVIVHHHFKFQKIIKTLIDLQLLFDVSNYWVATSLIV
jgi:hypothetical protein